MHRRITILDKQVIRTAHGIPVSACIEYTDGESCGRAVVFAAEPGAYEFSDGRRWLPATAVPFEVRITLRRIVDGDLVDGVRVKGSNDGESEDAGNLV